ncbi:uncharacterized protein LOC111404265 isoform X2 [Olea europaea var. sylvestris]|uniref:uncharacterized protein LOC111404265 isoform X2 n=1 Tax=Olea europaea var. sylvestris TaxID=158386 RepID=UPI000C1D6E08|nr:uncharacterized protein LOC111404265 isoform X2 [Olea europaea var. sylvestris]
MATISSFSTLRKTPQIQCRKKEKERGGQNNYPYKVIEITPPPKNLGIRCFPSWCSQLGQFPPFFDVTRTGSPPFFCSRSIKSAIIWKVEFAVRGECDN